MMQSSSVILFTTLLLLTFSTLTLLFVDHSSLEPSESKLKDVLVAIPNGWMEHPTNPIPPPEQLITLRVALSQPNFATLKSTLLRISDPSHPEYGQHLSKSEVDALVAPAKESTQLIHEWLSTFGIDVNTTTRSSSGDWIKVELPVRTAEIMLNCTYRVYCHPLTDSTIIRTTSYSLPSYLHHHIDLVNPTTMFGRPIKPMRISSSESGSTSSGTDTVDVTADCDAGIVTPACLKELYKTIDYVPSGITQNYMGVAGYLEEYANFADLKQFYATYFPPAQGSSFNVTLISQGKNDQSIPGGEANLDVQYAGAMSYPIPFTYYSTGGRAQNIPDALSVKENTNNNEPYQDFVDYILELDDPPLVITTSYGDDEQSVPRDYAMHLCNNFARLGVRGISVIFASGDGGVAGSLPPPYCASNDGKNTPKFIPTFPASCPYVTSVGATKLVPEVAAEFTSGGFSDYFPTPNYQLDAIHSYLNTIGPTIYQGMYNPKGRGIPDVSAQGVNYQVIIGGKLWTYEGTSAAAPTFAAIIALLNDYRMRNGNSSMGYLNPWLYSTGLAGLNDIVLGSNPGCNTTGFPAAPGWDPVTGLGTPDFIKLQSLVA